MSISELVTLVGLGIAFLTFLYLAMKEFVHSGLAAARSLKFQFAAATFVWLVGETLSVISTSLSQMELLEIHTISMATYAFFVVSRVFRLLPRRKAH